MDNRILKQLRQISPFGSLAEEVFIGVQIMADRLMAPWAETLKQAADLTPVQYNVLRILRGAGPTGLLAREISERLITRSPDVTRLVDRLVKRGLVDRSADPSDRRAVRVFITAEGLACIGSLDSLVSPVLMGAMARLGDERLEAMREMVNATLEALDESMETNPQRENDDV